MSRKKTRDRSARKARRQVARLGHQLRAFDLNVPVLSSLRATDGSLQTPKPLVYGTAFPLAPGLFATAAHVIEAAAADGTPGLSYVSSAADPMVHYAVKSYELVKAIDLAILEAPSLAKLPAFPIDFDRKLEFLANASALGFPLAMDAEFVTCIPRAFGGHVVRRRELYQLPGQPPGYELSFPAPEGLSGAPLVSTHYGKAFCYGYIIQQSTLGIGDHRAAVAIAVDVDVLLSVKTKYTSSGALAQLFGRTPVDAHKPSPKQLPGGASGFTLTELEEGWPDDDLPSLDEPTPEPQNTK